MRAQREDREPRRSRRRRFHTSGPVLTRQPVLASVSGIDPAAKATCTSLTWRGKTHGRDPRGRATLATSVTDPFSVAIEACRAFRRPNTARQVCWSTPLNTPSRSSTNVRSRNGIRTASSSRNAVKYRPARN